MIFLYCFMFVNLSPSSALFLPSIQLSPSSLLLFQEASLFSHSQPRFPDSVYLLSVYRIIFLIFFSHCFAPSPHVSSTLSHHHYRLCSLHHPCRFSPLLLPLFSVFETISVMSPCLHHYPQISQNSQRPLVGSIPLAHFFPASLPFSLFLHLHLCNIRIVGREVACGGHFLLPLPSILLFLCFHPSIPALFPLGRAVIMVERRREGGWCDYCLVGSQKNRSAQKYVVRERGTVSDIINTPETYSESSRTVARFHEHTCAIRSITRMRYLLRLCINSKKTPT